MKRKISIILTLVLMLSAIFSINVSAASKTAVSWSGIKTYATKSIKVYKNTKTTSSTGTIDNGDCITIKSYDKNSKRFNISYPVTRGKNKGATATGYIKAADVGYNLSYYPSKTWKVAKGFDIKGYTNSSKFNKCLTFNEGTTICEFGRKGEWISVVGKVSGSYWLMFIKKSDICKETSISSSKYYRITSKINTNYGFYVENGSKFNGANIQLHKWDKTSAQVFTFSKKSNGQYSIKNYKSKLCISVSNNNLYQSVSNDYFYIAEDDKGYITLKHPSNTKKQLMFAEEKPKTT